MMCNFICAFKGKIQWGRLHRKYAAEGYIFMPHQQEEYNEYILYYLDAYMKNNRINSISIVTCDGDMYRKIKRETSTKNDRIQVLFRNQCH